MAIETVPEANAVGLSVAALAMVVALLVKELSASNSLNKERLTAALTEVEASIRVGNSNSVAVEIVTLIKESINE